MWQVYQQRNSKVPSDKKINIKIELQQNISGDAFKSMIDITNYIVTKLNFIQPDDRKHCKCITASKVTRLVTIIHS